MTQADYRIEHEALILCARTELKSQSAARLRNLMAQQFDWVYFYKMARRHSLVPLVFFQLGRSAKECVPPDILQRFRKDYQENAARNLVLANELTYLVKNSAAAGIEMITFKGPALAMFAYDNLALRRFIDLDVMVRRADVIGAIRVLKARGYSTARRIEISQQELLLRTKQTQAERMFLLGFRLATDLFDAQLPKLITAAINSDKRIASLAAEIIQTLFNSDEQKPASSPAIFRYNFLIRKDWRSRAR